MDKCFGILELLEPEDETNTIVSAHASLRSCSVSVSGALARESRESRASALLLLMI